VNFDDSLGSTEINNVQKMHIAMCRRFTQLRRWWCFACCADSCRTTGLRSCL